jgi:hypothetical protein
MTLDSWITISSTIGSALSGVLATYYFLRSRDRKRAPESVTTTISVQPTEVPLPIEVPLPPVELLSAIAARECVVVIGSGMSVGAGMPTWSSLLGEIIHDSLEAGQIARFERLLETRPIDVVVDALRAQLPAAALTERIVRSISDFSRPDMKTYSVLAALPFSAVLSLNFDNLAARAFSRRSPSLFTAVDSERCLDALSRSEFFVFMLNGTIDKPREMLLSHQNLKDAVSRNDAFKDLLRRLYYSRTLFFVGVSFSGVENFLRVIDRTAEPTRTHFALVEVSDPAWEPVAKTMESQFRLKILPFTPHHREEAIDRFLRQIPLPIGAPRAADTKPPAKITKIELRNIGPFAECAFELDPRWTVLLGDNGVGKSTVLRAIAVGMCGKATDPFAERLLKSDTTSGSIRLWLGKKDYLTTITSKSGGGVIVKAESGGVLRENESILAVGYPALRTVGARRDVERKSGPQRANPNDLLPLTSEEPDPRLDNIKEWIIQLAALKDSKETNVVDRERYAALYDRVFSLLGALTAGVDVHPARVDVKAKQITVLTKDGTVPFETLSQGTLSLVSWAGALMQRLYETASEGRDPLSCPAIAMVDEIDAHMHPAWQQTIVKRLDQMFPEVQFIVTSHSPLVVGGLEPNQVYRFERNARGVVQITQPEVALKGMGAAGLLTSPLFGLQSQLDTDTADALRRKRQLTAQRLDAKSPDARKKVDQEIQKLDEQVKFVDSTEFIRDPLYQRFVEAVSKVEPKPDAAPDPAVLTPEERKRKAEVAQQIVRELIDQPPEKGRPE